jgi:hypothetical protein
MVATAHDAQHEILHIEHNTRKPVVMEQALATLPQSFENPCKKCNTWRVGF